LDRFSLIIRHFTIATPYKLHKRSLSKKKQLALAGAASFYNIIVCSLYTRGAIVFSARPVRKGVAGKERTLAIVLKVHTSAILPSSLHELSRLQINANIVFERNEHAQ
jgi:hypothetical protein